MNYNKTLEEGLVETAERIVIDYANISGRESANRAEFRQEVIKHLTTFAEKIREGIVEEVEGMRNNVEKRGSSCRINGVIDDESAGGGYLQALDDLLAQLKKI